MLSDQKNSGNNNKTITGGTKPSFSRPFTSSSKPNTAVNRTPSSSTTGSAPKNNPNTGFTNRSSTTSVAPSFGSNNFGGNRFGSNRFHSNRTSTSGTPNTSASGTNSGFSGSGYRPYNKGQASTNNNAPSTGNNADGSKKVPFRRPGGNSKPGFGGRKPGMYNKSQNQPYQYPYSKVILTKRVDKVVSGGRNSSFVAIVVVGNGVDRVGVGTAGGKTIVDAIAHAKQNAANRVIIPSKIKYLKYKHCSTEVIIKRRNVDIIRTAGYISSIFKACGLKNVSCKIIGSNNPMNTIYAVFNALTQHIQFRRNTMILKGILKQQNTSDSNTEA